MGIGRETVHGYLSDMLLVERELHAAIRQQRDSDSAREVPVAHRLLARIEQRVDEHIVTLARALEELGESESLMKSALGVILGAAAGLFDRVRLDTQLSRMLRDDYAALSFASVCYEMLHTTALAVHEPHVAETALRHLSGYARCIVEIGNLMPAVLLAELQDEGTATPDPALVGQAQRNVRAAWSPESHAPA